MLSNYVDILGNNGSFRVDDHIVPSAQPSGKAKSFETSIPIEEFDILQAF